MAGWDNQPMLDAILRNASGRHVARAQTPRYPG